METACVYLIVVFEQHGLNSHSREELSIFKLLFMVLFLFIHCVYRDNIVTNQRDQ